ncbi:Dna Excision Repair Protein Ercc-8 [Manis pentadactyla]|nr:Dna Excision Repair Protein Ercc-8 [Manis pentadactyla]
MQFSLLAVDKPGGSCIRWGPALAAGGLRISSSYHICQAAALLTTGHFMTPPRIRRHPDDTTCHLDSGYFDLATSKCLFKYVLLQTCVLFDFLTIVYLHHFTPCSLKLQPKEDRSIASGIGH